jgi:hypothetical protein
MLTRRQGRPLSLPCTTTSVGAAFAPRHRPGAWALALATVVYASTAVAEAPLPAPAATSSSWQAPAAPPVASPSPETDSWAQTVAAYEWRMEQLRRQIEYAEEYDREGDVVALQKQLDRTEDAFKRFMKRSRKRYSPAMMVGGVVLTTAGAISTVAGLATVLPNVACIGTEPDQPCEHQYGLGAALIAAGLIGIGVGVPLLVIGKKKVVEHPERGETVQSAHLVLGTGVVGFESMGVAVRGAF